MIENVKTHLQIGGRDFLIDPDLMQRFREYMSIKVPGSFFAAKHLKFHWDGLKYFLTPGGVMATGFLPVLLRYIEEVYSDLEVEIIDSRGQLPQFRSEFIAKIGPIIINEEYIHQKHLIETYNHSIIFRGQSIYFPRGVIDAATNSGKTAIIAGILLNLTTEEKNVVHYSSKNGVP